MRVLIRPKILHYLLATVSILDVFPIFTSLQSWSLDKAPEPKTSVIQSPVVNTSEDGKLEALLKQEKYQEIIDQLTPNLDKLDSKNLKLLGRAQSGLKNSLMAIKIYSLALNKNPKDVEAKVLLGKENFLRGKDREAMISLREALDLNPNLEEAYLVIEQIYIKKKNNYELRMLYQDMVQQMGEKPKYIERLCELNTLSGIYDLAAKYCLQGIKLQPDEAKNYTYRAMTLKETGFTDDAKKLYKTTADKFKQSEEAQLAYAQFLDEQKNFLDSSKYYKDAMAANPQSVKALYGFAQASTEIQRYQDVYDALVTACNLNRQSIAQVRKVMRILQLLKENVWYSKFELLSETCGLPPKPAE
jgi:tetratricopeptide (TPR) repeat protein